MLLHHVLRPPRTAALSLRTSSRRNPPTLSSPASDCRSHGRLSIRRAPFSTSPPRSASVPSSSDATATAGDAAHGTPVGHDSHESHFDAPGGWLWGVPPGEKREKEGWEGVWVYGFFGSLAFAFVAYAFKPDSSIQTWALEEARRRLEAEGILKDENPRAGQ
ncbi:MAG: hypothetical protein M1837_000420 [Sclerophora amabilis]|nr:MAG: hypothetical protein M1837_000420 [Sclerophora amabilis]